CPSGARTPLRLATPSAPSSDRNPSPRRYPVGRYGAASPPPPAAAPSAPRPLLQTHTLPPGPPPAAGAARLPRPHRRRSLGPLRHVAHRHRQVPFAIPHRQRSVQPLFDPHVGSTQPADDRRPVDLIHL